MLYIISTPIGNLKDITFRAIDTLSKCDYVLSEDTRISKILFNHYSIKTPLVSFHKFNERKNQKRIIQDLKSGKIIGLISDAGTPLISDPGYNLLQEVYEENIQIEAIPGACSIIQALVLSGFSTSSFQFLGFLPKKPNELNFSIKKMLFFDGTSLCFETSKRIKKTVDAIATIDPKRRLAILKEMTKKFEKRISMNALDLSKFLDSNILKGEIVLVVEKGDIPDNIDIEETIKLLQKFCGMDLKQAIKASANLKNISKKTVYKKMKIK